MGDELGIYLHIPFCRQGFQSLDMAPVIVAPPSHLAVHGLHLLIMGLHHLPLAGGNLFI